MFQRSMAQCLLAGKCLLLVRSVTVLKKYLNVIYKTDMNIFLKNDVKRLLSTIIFIAYLYVKIF